jgi:MFS family permease
MVDDPREPGQYAGWLSASGQFGRLFSSLALGRFSDTHGRKPVVQIGLFATMVSSLLFGLTLNYWLGCALRFACGLCDFLFGIVKIYIAEGVDEQHRAKAMTYSGGMWGIAIIVGPTIGGVLARPAVQYPGMFAADGVFGRLPYLLPCVVVSGCCAMCLVLSHVALKETVPNALGYRCCCCAKTRREQQQQKASQNNGQSDQAGSGSSGGTKKKKKKKKKWSRFFCQKRAALPMFIYTLLVTAELTEDVAFPLWSSAPVSSGGLGFSPLQIGQVMAMIGICVIPVQLFLYPWLDKRVGPIAIIRWGTLMSAIATPVMPLATYPLGVAHAPTQIWSCIAIGHVLRYAFTEMCFVANSLVSNNAVSQADRGTYIGVQSTMISVGTIVGPIASGPLVAWSLTNGLGFPFNWFFVFLLCSAILFVVVALAFSMPRSLEKALDERSPDEEDEEGGGETESLLAGHASGDEDEEGQE